VLLLIAALLWSLGGVLMKNAPIQAIPQAERGPILACYRVLFAALCLAPLIPWRLVRFRRELAVTALAYAVMNLLYVCAVTRTSAAAAIFLQYTSAGWSYLLSWLILRERPTRGDLAAITFALIGIIWIMVSEWHGDQWLGNLLAIGSGLAYAAVVVGMRSMRNEPTTWIVFCNNLLSGVLLLPWVWTFQVTLSQTQWSIIAALGIVQLGLPYLLLGWGVRTVPAQESVLITILEALLNPIWVWMFVGELPTTATWIGGGFILAGLILRYTVFRDRTPANVPAPA
jgi:DME family drug/metabolite transporter